MKRRSVDNAEVHVTAFRPISEAARSWSDNNMTCRWVKRATTENYERTVVNFQLVQFHMPPIAWLCNLLTKVWRPKSRTPNITHLVPPDSTLWAI